MSYRLGVDVGGTNTDAVVVGADDRVVAKVKQPVTNDVGQSIREAVRGVLNASGIHGREITHAMLGTTQVTNAIIERRERRERRGPGQGEHRGLNRVGIIRIGRPATLAVPPLRGWPPDLREVVDGGVVIVEGGHEYDGSPLAPLDRDAIRRFLDAHAARLEAVAVTAVFSPVNPDHERWVRDLVETEYPHLLLSMSHEIGSVGLLERENATVLNAAVMTVARRTAEAFSEALDAAGVSAAVFLSQNDGTLMALEYAMRFPILTVACGPTNSMRGAAFLSKLEDAIVVDVGGTTTDIGVIRGGFPRPATMAVEVGGVRTNFRMPDLITLGLGGGSRIRLDADGRPIVGPDSVGFRLSEVAQVFGGSDLTLTDVAVRIGAAHIGTKRPSVDRETAREAYTEAVRLLESAIDRIKAAAEAMPLVAVGGGSVLLPERLDGVSEIVRPPHYDVANAIGAALAEVSGRVDRVFAIGGRDRRAVLDEARRLAEADAVRAGADPDRLRVVEMDDVPLTYLPGHALRVRVTVAGPLGR